MRGGGRPEIRRLLARALLAEQGQPGGEIYLLLDGVVTVSVDDTELAELGPGRSWASAPCWSTGSRTATLRAVTDCVVAATDESNVDRERLQELERLHHREDADG